MKIMAMASRHRSSECSDKITIRQIQETNRPAKESLILVVAVVYDGCDINIENQQRQKNIIFEICSQEKIHLLKSSYEKENFHELGDFTRYLDCISWLPDS